MKRKLTLNLLFFTLFGVGISSLSSSPTGTPGDGRTGSPGDGGKTCAVSGCHSFATVSDATGIITSNIPTEGYTPGSTYTITVTVVGNGKKGLCVSPQKTDGTLVGSLTAGSGNQLVNGKYITHTTPNTSSTAVWSFTWVAPVAGTGAVDFYGAFAITTSTVKKTKVTFNEKAATGINENSLISGLSFYPNPVANSELTIGFNLKKSGDVIISILDISGREVSVLKQERMNDGRFEEHFNLPKLSNGIYFIRTGNNGEVLTKKILVQQD